MAQPNVDENQNEMGKHQTVLLEQILKATHEMIQHLSCLNEKANCAEMRQCLTSGEGTDAARMTGQYICGNSAVWSTTHRARVLEMIYDAGEVQSIEYEGLFLQKDTRRSEFLVAVFWMTFAEKSDKKFDVRREAEHNKLAPLMATFRREMFERAKQKDIELGPEAVKKLSFGSYETRIREALGDLPKDLLTLSMLAKPVNKQHKIVESVASDTSGEMNNESFYEGLYQTLPQDIKRYVEWCATTCQHVDDDVRSKVTHAIVHWSDYMHMFNKKKKELADSKYQKQREEWTESDMAKEAKRYEIEMSMLENYAKQHFSRHRDVLNEHAKLTSEA